MSLKSKKEETGLPDDFEVKNTQISFDDLEFEAEYIGEEELNKTTEYYTITGKVQEYNASWEKYTIQDFDVGQELEGKPEVTIFEKKDKTYNACKLRLIDEDEIVDLYFNYPKKECPYVEKLNKYFDFYRNCFDFIFSILKYRDETNVIDKNGEEVDYFKKVNLETFMKYVDTMERVRVKITEGNPDSEYLSWIITKME